MVHRQKSNFLLVCLLTTLVACGGGETDNSGNDAAQPEQSSEAKEVHGDQIQPGDVKMTNPLNAEWVSKGKSIYDVKCQGCHKLTDERVVGPGWKGVTKKREPHWIVNMITNVDMMLETDPEAQKLLEQCLVRMPNQNLTKDDARHVLEYMRNNDGEK